MASLSVDCVLFYKLIDPIGSSLNICNVPL